MRAVRAARRRGREAAQQREGAMALIKWMITPPKLAEAKAKQIKVDVK